jgi:hypothetical protein
VFLHGASGSSSTFGKQLNGKLGELHGCVAINFPGHGGSSRPFNPRSTFSTEGLSTVVLAVVKAYGLDSAVFVGVGLGAQVMAAAAAQLPLAKGFFFAGSDSAADTAADEALEYFRGTDVAQLVSGLRAPVGFICGANDFKAVAVDGNMWRSSVQVVPGAGHSVASEQPAAFDTLVRAFIADNANVEAPDLHNETFGTCSGIHALLPERKKGVMRKEVVGKTHLKARYEDPHPDDLATEYRSYDTSPGKIVLGSTTSHVRGRAPPGALPHKNSRFEAHVDVEEEEQPDNHMLGNPMYGLLSRMCYLLPSSPPHSPVNLCNPSNAEPTITGLL